MLLLQAAAETAHGAPAAAAQAGHAAEAASHGAVFHPVLPWLIVGLPLLGFVLNGLASLIAARRALPRVPPVGDPHWDTHGHDHAHAPQQVAYAGTAAGHGHDAHTPSEQEGMDAGTRPNPAQGISLLAATAAGRMTGEVRPHEVQPAEPDDRGHAGLRGARGES